VKDCEKTGSGLDTLLDTAPFFNEIEELVSASEAVNPEYVSDSMCPKEEKKWYLDALKTKTKKAAARRPSPVNEGTAETRTSITPPECTTPKGSQSDPDSIVDVEVTGYEKNQKSKS